MTSSNGNTFRVTGLLWEEFTGHRWIPLTQKIVTRNFDVFIDLRLNKREAGDLRRHRAHYYVILMYRLYLPVSFMVASHILGAIQVCFNE